MPAARPSLTTRSSISVRGYSSTVPAVHLAHQRLVRTEQQLLAGLTARVERARHLRAAEGAVVEQAAVLPCERHALRDALVDDVDRHLREPVHVRLAGAVVAALDRVVEEAVDAVAVVLVVLRRVDPALRGDGVRTAGRVVERDDLHVVAELAERRGGRRAGEAGADDDDVEPALVRRVDELDRELVVVPLLGESDRRDSASRASQPGLLRRIARRGSGRAGTSTSTRSSCTAIGNVRLPTRITAAKPCAKQRRALLYVGLLSPRLWNSDQAPWYRWNAERDVGDDVDDRDRHAFEAVHQVVVRVAAHEVGLALPHVRSTGGRSGRGRR